ncbi:hypothetical protein YC2023_060604 [Brassica napus]
MTWRWSLLWWRINGVVASQRLRALYDEEKTNKMVAYALVSNYIPNESIYNYHENSSDTNPAAMIFYSETTQDDESS